MTLQEFAVTYSQAWAAHDSDAISALHTEDSVFHLHDISPPAEGRPAVRDFIKTLFTAAPICVSSMCARISAPTFS